MAPVPGPAFGQARREEVSLRLGWIGKGYDAPYYLTLEKGFFAENGLAVTIYKGQGSTIGMKLVANKSNTFGTGPADALAKSIDGGLPLRMLLCAFQRTPITFLMHQDTQITRPKDLEGKRVAFPPGSGQAQVYPAFVAATGIDGGKVRVASIDAGSLLTILLERKVDAVLAWVTDRVILEGKGAKVAMMQFADYGLTLLGNGLYTHTDLIAQRPDLVRRFTQASSRGYSYTLEHREEAMAALLKHVPGLDPAVERKILDITLDLRETPNSKGKTFGWMAREDWQKTIETM
ncbi:MAG: ABC transporter substrate-binding protein, partial [Deltaproteobacteria bacterium]|nr:ABC transporter substrate-binding protein [Deltaproteobacteria bacterium]